MVNAMLWVLKTGAPWRDLPEHYGPWLSVYTRFSRWSKAGLWAAVLGELTKKQDGAKCLIDATIVRAHQDASGARKKTAAKRSGDREADRAQRFTPVSTAAATRALST